MKDYTDIIIAPVITEKVNAITSKQPTTYVFKVKKNANKHEIKDAIEKAFQVHVVKLNTLITKSKAKKVGKYAGRTKTYKKAIFTIKDGEKIEI